MNQIQVFENKEFGELEVIMVDDKPYFPATECAKVLGYNNPQQAIRLHCKGVLKISTPSKGGNQHVNYIPEGDLYRLIIRSKLPAAEKFERWVFDEVVPSIRKHGAYMTPKTIESILLTPETVITLARKIVDVQEKNHALTLRVNEMRTKERFADALAVSDDTILVRELAKLLVQNGINVGQNRLFKWLRDNGYLIRRRCSDYNMPTQKSMDLGLFAIKETIVTHSDGRIRISKTPKVTGIGQFYFINLFLM